MPLSTGPVKALEMSENRYDVNKAKGNRESDEVFKGKVRLILNKLTPEKFEKLFEQFCEIGIENVEALKMAIDEIFDKALGEMVFGSMYAVLCQRLSEKLPEFVDEEGNKMSFRRLLLNKCQEEFEKESEIAACKEDLERMKMKRRMLGNIHFIGELYLKRMLKENIMYFCIAKLVGEPESPDDEDIEALCKLLTTIGGTLDRNMSNAGSKSSSGVGHLDKCFAQLKQIKEASPVVVEARYRFMIADVFDMRANHWQSRQKSIGPTTISAVHQAKEEKMGTGHNPRRRGSFDANSDGKGRGQRGGGANARAPKNSAPVFGSRDQGKRSQDQRGGGGGDGWAVAGQDSKKSGGDDEWETAGSARGSQRGGRDNGRGGGSGARKGGAPQDARRGGSGFKQEEKKPEKKKVSSPGGAFGGLMVDDEEEEEEEEEEAGSPTESGSPKPAAGGALSQAELTKKVESILDEYLASNDEDEAALGVKELEANSLHAIMVGVMINHVAEKKEEMRTKVDKLLVHLVAQKILDSTSTVKGLTEIMGTVDDISMDVPKFGNYVAKSTGLLAAAGGVPAESFSEILAPLDGAPLKPKMLAWVVDAIGDEAKAKAWYAGCGVKLVDAMMEGDQTEEAAKDLLERSSMKCAHLVWMCSP